MTHWQPQYTIDDLHTIEKILIPYLENLPADTWHMKTGIREKDWTLREVLAHLVSIAFLFYRAVDDGIEGRPMERPVFHRREDLRDFNSSQQIYFAEHTPEKLIKLLQVAFIEITAQIEQRLKPEHYEQTIDLKIYGRPMRLIDVVDAQLSHIGVVHSYQIKRTFLPDLQSAVWNLYPWDMLARMVDRFLRHLSYTYWHDRAGGLTGDIHFDFHLKGMKSWTMTLTPDGAWLKRGLTDTMPLVKFLFRDFGIFYRVFTQEMSLTEAIRQIWLIIEGDYSEPLTLLSYFNPSPPKRPLPLG